MIRLNLIFGYENTVERAHECWGCDKKMNKGDKEIRYIVPGINTTHGAHPECFAEKIKNDYDELRESGLL